MDSYDVKELIRFCAELSETLRVKQNRLSNYWLELLEDFLIFSFCRIRITSFWTAECYPITGQRRVKDLRAMEFDI